MTTPIPPTLEQQGKEIEELREELAEALWDAQVAEDDVDAARAAFAEALRWLRDYGGHAADCLLGALAGSKALHPACTCGWNHVATIIERW